MKRSAGTKRAAVAACVRQLGRVANGGAQGPRPRPAPKARAQGPRPRPAPRALKGGHGERLRRRKQPQPASAFGRRASK